MEDPFLYYENMPFFVQNLTGPEYFCPISTVDIEEITDSPVPASTIENSLLRVKSPVKMSPMKTVGISSLPGGCFVKTIGKKAHQEVALRREIRQRVGEWKVESMEARRKFPAIWDDCDDEILRLGVIKNERIREQEIDWQVVHGLFPERSFLEVWSRWNVDLVRGAGLKVVGEFQPEEDVKLLKLADELEYEGNKFAIISDFLYGRTPQQVENRFLWLSQVQVKKRKKKKEKEKISIVVHELKSVKKRVRKRKRVRKPFVPQFSQPLFSFADNDEVDDFGVESNGRKRRKLEEGEVLLE